MAKNWTFVGLKVSVKDLLGNCRWTRQPVLSPISTISLNSKRANLSNRTCRHSANRLTALAILLLCVVASSGCSSRRVVVRTQPEGAFVTIDGYPVGYSPVATSYTYGGNRDFLIEKDGYESVRQKVDLSDPWYLRPPISFFTENFSPVEIRHQPVLDFQLQPKSRINGEVLLQRANTLRDNVQRGTVTAPAR